MKYLIFIILLVISISLFQCSNPKKEFTIWIGGAPEEVDFWAQLIKKYEKQTGYSVQLIRQPTYTDQRRQSLEISLEAKQPNPDLFLMDVVWINQFIQSGWLQSLTPYIKKNNFSTDVFFQRVLNSVDKFNNSLYALPVFLDVGLLYYRKDLLEKYGFDGPPQTWNELVKQCEEIVPHEKGKNSNFSGFDWQGAQYEGLVCTFLEFIASNGGGILKDGKIELNTPENLKALQFMHDLIYKYKISPPNTYTEMREEQVRRAFQNGNTLFERNWAYAWNLHQSNDSPVKGKIGMTILPHFEDHSSVSTLGGWHIGMSKYSDVKDKAWDFIRYITSYNVQKELLLKVGWNPGRSDVYKDKELLEKIPRLEILSDAFNITVARPTIPYYPQFSDIVQRYVNDCLANKIKPGNALEEMQKQVNQLSALYNEK
jgi:trehalose/maltose transport system substrate-binding protein